MNKFLKGCAPLVLATAPIVGSANSSVRTFSSSRMNKKNTIVSESSVEASDSPFHAFTAEMFTSEDSIDKDVLEFLANNNLLDGNDYQQSSSSGATDISSDDISRKEFAGYDLCSGSSGCQPGPANSAILINNNLRIGDGSVGSINTLGNLSQPFFKDASVWNVLTYADYPLEFAIGIGGDGTNEWNLNGTILDSDGAYADYTLTGHTVDTSGFTATSGNEGYGTLISTGNISIGGKTLEVKRTYELPQNANYIKITTKLTNNSGAAIANVRGWVGTGDDHVAGEDSPTETRGNLVDGAFVAISSASQRATAIKIESAGAGIFFYSPFTSANASIADCCRFSESVNTNPTASAITESSDNSYAMFFRLADLANGESDEFSLYYAAGAIGELGDIADEVANVGADSDGTVTAGTGVDESTPITISPAIVDSGSAIDIFDFKITDPGSADATDLTVTSVDIHVSGDNNAKLTYLLSGPDINGNITGTYSAGTVTFDLTGSNIVITDTSNETYTVKAFFNDATSLSDNSSITVTIDGDTDLTLASGSTTMASSQAAITNSGNTQINITATKLLFTTQPAASISGISLTQPVVAAVDANDNVDTDYTSIITLSEASSGELTGDLDITAIAGVATFTDVLYSATADSEGFTLTATDSSLTDATANAVTSDVLATKLTFTTQPAPTALQNGSQTTFTAQPVVTAQNAQDLIDTDFVETITITENGAGVGTFTNNTKAAIAGVATFSGMTLSHNADETFQLVADDVAGGAEGDLPAVNSSNIVTSSNQAPTITGASAAQAINDTATLTPFSSVTLADNEGDNLSITISLDTNTKGVLSGTGLTGTGPYTLASDTIANVQTKLRALIFNPANNRVAVGATETTTFTLSANDGSSNSTPNVTTTVISTSVNDTPTGIALSNTTVAQSLGANASVGTLSSTDADTSESFSYTLVAGTGDGDNANFNISGASLRATDSSNLSAGNYTVRIQTNDGHSATYAKAFTITVTDDVNPTLLSLSPADNATDISTIANLVITLNEDVVKGVGDLLIKKTIGDVLVETIPVGDARVSIAAGTVTINPNTTLDLNTQYYVQIPATALNDNAGNSYAGITDTTSWSFTTIANTAPTVSSLPTPLTITEDIATAINLSATTFADTEGDSLTVTLAVNSGTIASIDGNGVIGGVTIANSGTSSMTIAGTIADIHTYLDTVSKIEVTTVNHSVADITLTVTPNDGVSSGISAISTISVTAVNDEPTLTATASNPTFTENGSAASLFTSTAISAVEMGQNITALTVTVTNVDDTSDEVLNFDGSAISLVDGSGTTATNSFSYSVAVVGTTATVTLSGGSVGNGLMQTLVNAISYQNNSEKPTTTNTRIVTLVSISDDGGTANGGDDVAAISVASTVTVVAVNDIPVIANLDGDSFTYNEDSGALIIDQASALTLTDVDSADFDGGNITVTITSGEDAAEDLLSFSVAGTVSFASNAAGADVSVGGTTIGTLANNITAGNDLVVNLNANANPVNIQALLRAITYSNTDSGAPTTGARNVRVTVTDGDGGVSANNDVTITVAGVNDAADIGGDLTGGTIEDNGTGATGTLTVTDVDTNESTFTAQTANTTTYGTFSVNTSGNWTYDLDSTKAAVQALANGATMTDIITIASVDGTQKQITITITGVNGVATITGISAGAATEDDATQITGSLSIADEDTGEAVFVAQTNAAGSYGAFNLATSGNWTYDLDSTKAAVQALPDGSTLTDSFTATSADSTDSQLVTITITGVNGVATITGTSTGAATEDDATQITGSLAITDEDTGEAVFVEQANTAGTYGGFTLATNGDWTYDLDNTNGTVQALIDGGTLTDSFTAVSADGTDSQLVTVTITGVNGVATITGTSTGAATEDNETQITGSLSIADEDTGEAVFTVQANTAGTYGDFTLATNGNWTYDLDNTNGTVQALIDGGTLTDSFTAVSADGTDSQLVTVTITGVNGVATITGTSTGAATEDDATQITGSLAITDEDTDEAVFVAQTNAAGSYGFFSLTLTGTWSYQLDSSNLDVQILPEGETLTDSFTVSSVDGSDSQVVTITITGINDVATITGTSIADTNEDNTAQVTGSLSITDKDTGEAIFMMQSGVAGTYGTFNIDNQGNWTFTLDNDNTEVQQMSSGEQLTDSFTVMSIDGTDSQVITVKVFGVNDAPNAEHDELTVAVNVDNVYVLDVLANDSDVDGDTLSIVGANTSLGTVSTNGESLTLTTQAGFVGQVVLTYTITDGNNVFSETTVDVDITGALSETAPVVTVPGTVEVNAEGLFTKVDLGVATALNSQGQPVPISLVDGAPLFRPGNSIAYWQAIDPKTGLTTVASQKVIVHPIISLGKDQVVVEGEKVSVDIILNGEAPAYPVAITLSISGSVDDNDYDIETQEVTIESGTQTSVLIDIVQDNVIEGNETLIVNLGEGNISDRASQVITIVESNIAPKVTLSSSQNAEERQLVTPTDGLVSINAIVIDANDDNVSTQWLYDPALNISEIDDFTLTLDPSGLDSGIYSIGITVIDDGEGNLSTTQTLYFEVLASLAVLTDIDSDGDLIPDNEEGHGDSDQDGIPDFLDAIAECNVMPEQAAVQDGFLVEGEPGVCLRKGNTLAAGETGGLQLTDNDLDNSVGADEGALIVGGAFDFIATGLPQAGQSYQIVLPQIQPIPTGAVYRKYSGTNGWGTFVEDADNQLHSAAGEQGICPPPASVQWSPGLTEGHWCVQLTIEDGGPNDDDGLANGTIVDPGGVSVLLTGNTMPVAQADVVTLKWNDSILIDALANDSDVDGDALSIGVATATFGSVTITADNQLDYQSKADFIGQDTIVYSLSDGKGGTSSGTVSITVYAYENVTVNNKSKGGSMGLIIISLIGVTLYRIRRKKSIGKKQLVQGAAALTVATSMSLSAAEPQWFITGSVGKSHANSHVNIPSDIGITDSELDKSSTSYTIGGGVNYGVYSFTVSYEQLGDSSASYDGDVINTALFHQTLANVAPKLVDGISLQGQYTLWQGDALSASIGAGLFAWELDYTSTLNDSVIKVSEDDVDFIYNLQVAYAITEQVQVSLKASRYSLSVNDINNLALGLTYHF